MIKTTAISMLFFVLSVFSMAQGIEQFIPERPAPARLVNDYLNILTEDQKQTLEKKLVAFDDSTTNQIALITIGDIGDYEIEDFAVALGRKWGIGGKDYNNGIVLIVYINQERQKRKVWIAVGYGLEGAIPDITAKEIIENEILPNFKAKDIYRGLDEGTDALILASSGEYKAPEGYHKRKNKDGGSVLGIIIFIIIFLIIAAISRGGGGGMMSGRGRRHWGSTPPIWFPSGGFGSGRSGGGFGGGGFGGFGGGSFGGGGAGGSW